MATNTTRRGFLSLASSTAATAAAAARLGDKPALLGGQPIRRKPFPRWPVVRKNDEKSWTAVLRSLKWNRSRGESVNEFERAWAQTLGAKYCLATNGGTTALWTAMNALEVGPKDEVLVPPYTFIATINVVLLQHALPVFVDTDRETFQMDATKIEAAITPNTRTILPVHVGGAAADMDAILAQAGQHNLSVVEDACQSHLAEWNRRRVSTLGDVGCFSFQASKNLNCGEGGALITDSDALMARAERFHSNGKSFEKSSQPLPHAVNGCNVRMTEFQAALLLSQMERLDAQARLREQNAGYLTSLLREIDGIEPARMYPGCTRNAYHLYMFRYDSGPFAGLPREQFLKALRAEGVPCSGGYKPLNKNPFLKHTFESRSFKKIYSSKEIGQWFERNHMPENDRLCQEAVWFTQSTLLSSRGDMEQITDAILKVQKFAADLRDA